MSLKSCVAKCSMYKLKNKSSAKKRFKVKKSGVVLMTQAKKRHNARKLSSRSARSLRGTVVARPGDARLIKQCLPVV